MKNMVYGIEKRKEKKRRHQDNFHDRYWEADNPMVAQWLLVNTICS